MFEKASKLKLRFPTERGMITAEDLWDLPLTGAMSLNEVAKEINRSVQAEDEEDFVSEKSETDKTSVLRLDIVKHVIASKIKSRESAEKRVETRNRNDKIRSIIARKKDNDLAEASIEDLEALIKE